MAPPTNESRTKIKRGRTKKTLEERKRENQEEAKKRRTESTPRTALTIDDEDVLEGASPSSPADTSSREDSGRWGGGSGTLKAVIYGSEGKKKRRKDEDSVTAREIRVKVIFSAEIGGISLAEDKKRTSLKSIPLKSTREKIKKKGKKRPHNDIGAEVGEGATLSMEEMESLISQRQAGLNSDETPAQEEKRKVKIKSRKRIVVDSDDDYNVHLSGTDGGRGSNNDENDRSESRSPRDKTSSNHKDTSREKTPEPKAEDSVARSDSTRKKFLDKFLKKKIDKEITLKKKSDKETKRESASSGLPRKIKKKEEEESAKGVSGIPKKKRVSLEPKLICTDMKPLEDVKSSLYPSAKKRAFLAKDKEDNKIAESRAVADRDETAASTTPPRSSLVSAPSNTFKMQPPPQNVIQHPKSLETAPTQRDRSRNGYPIMSDLDQLIAAVMDGESAASYNAKSSNGPLDWNGSFLASSQNRLDFHDRDEDDNVVIQPEIPCFPEDFPKGQKPWPLRWWGIVPPPVELIDEIKMDMQWEKDNGMQGKFPPGQIHPCQQRMLKAANPRTEKAESLPNRDPINPHVPPNEFDGKSSAGGDKFYNKNNTNNGPITDRNTTDSGRGRGFSNPGGRGFNWGHRGRGGGPGNSGRFSSYGRGPGAGRGSNTWGAPGRGNNQSWGGRSAGRGSGGWENRSWNNAVGPPGRSHPKNERDSHDDGNANVRRDDNFPPSVSKDSAYDRRA